MLLCDWSGSGSFHDWEGRQGRRVFLLRIFLDVWLTHSRAALALMWPLRLLGGGGGSEVKEPLGQELPLFVVFLGILGGEGFESAVKRQK